MAEVHANHHDYHLVNPSPWPAVGAVSAFILAVGAISWMHQMYSAAPIVFGVGTLGVTPLAFDKAEVAQGARHTRQ